MRGGKLGLCADIPPSQKTALIWKNHSSNAWIERPSQTSLCRLGTAGAWVLLAVFAAPLLAPIAGYSQGSVSAGAAGATNLDIQADFSDYDRNLGIARATGDVIVKYGDVTIEADQVEYHQSSGMVFARDNVRVFKDGEVVEAEEIIYNVRTGELTTSQLKSALEPIFYTSDNIIRPEADSDGPITLHDATFTTHDSAIPNYRFRVKKLEVYPDDRVVMRGARLYAGEVPVFWFPYYVQPLDEELGYYFTPGWNTPWGAFLLNQYGFMIGDDIIAKTALDLRSERGIAGGVEFKSRKLRHQPNYGRLNLYFAQDNDPSRSFSGLRRTNPPDSSRYRVNLQHRVYFPGSEDETLYLDIDLNRLSDAHVYEDFFPSEFRIDPRPDNVANLVKRFDQAEVSLTGRFQVNDFFQTDTRTPELAIDVIRTPIADSGFFYEGLTTYGILDEKYPKDLVASGFLEPGGYNRFQTYHQFLYPTKFGGVLNVVPRAGAGYANYSNFDLPGINGFDSTTTHLGVDLSFKLSKASPHIVNRALGINGLLHVVRPYLNYSYVSTNEVNGRFNPIDRLTPSTRLRPIDLPLFTAMDDLRDWQIARTGVSQHWYTKRNGASYQWLSLNNYLDIFLDDPEFDRNISNFFTELQWNPLPWLGAGTTAQAPIANDAMSFTEMHTYLQFTPTDWFRFEVGHYRLNSHPFFEDSNLYSLSTYTRLSDNWGFSTNHRFESDDSTLEYQQYMIHRDLASWTANLGAIVRDNRRDEKEYGVVLGLTLKAFPKVRLPVDFQPGTLGAD